MSAPAWRRYLRFWRSDLAADLDDEFRFHLETEIEELVTLGMAPEAARETALRRFGDVDLYRRHCRAADERRAGRERRTENLSVLAQDLRYAIRSLRRQPLFATIAVVTLALGIGANTAIFSVVNGVLLKPLPYREPERLVMLWETMKDADRIMVSYPNFLDWRARQRLFEDITVYNPFDSQNMTGQGDAERVRSALVAGNYFQLLGVRPGLGRLIEPTDDTPASAPVAVLSHGYFRSRFGGDPSVIGKTLVLDGRPYTVVGVMPKQVRLADRDIILPVARFAKGPMFARESHPGLIGLGRLKPGVSVQQAQADLQRVSAELRAEYPRENAGIGSAGAPLLDMVVRRIKPALRILMIAVGLVLLIACANVANLVLSRSAARQREFALRTALGAGRGRIVRQLLTESLVLALAGGLLGVVVAMAGVKFLISLEPGSVPRLMDIRVDTTVLLFALGVSVATGVLFGLGPALQSGRSAPVTALKEGSRGSSAGAARQRTRATLTVAEVAIAVVLLAGAGLLLRSFAKLTAVNPGFDASNVLGGVVRLPQQKYPTSERRQAAFDEMLQKLRAIPGVESATFGSDLPVTTNWQTSVSFEGLAPFPPGKAPLLNAANVDPSYFETLRIPLIAGRHFVATDGEVQRRAVIISEGIAKRFYPNVSPIGRRMKEGLPTDTIAWRTIVGVVKDTRTDGLTEQPRGTFYLPRAESEMRGGWLIVRSRLPVQQLTAAMRRALAEVDRDVPLSLAQTMDAVLAAYAEEQKFSMLMLTIFAAVALVLASVGIYGVISYNVTRRTGEIGVRIALGARRVDVIGLVVGQAMAMAVAGVAIGVLLALWSGKTLSSMLFGVGPRDPLVLGMVSVFLIAVALAAALAPALRAARIDPTIAIRGD
jgi:putative ABC transport system permease protein